jgi:hypothetical protein
VNTRVHAPPPQLDMMWRGSGGAAPGNRPAYSERMRGESSCEHTRRPRNQTCLLLKREVKKREPVHQCQQSSRCDDTCARDATIVSHDGARVRGRLTEERERQRQKSSSCEHTCARRRHRCHHVEGPSLEGGAAPRKQICLLHTVTAASY